MKALQFVVGVGVVFFSLVTTTWSSPPPVSYGLTSEVSGNTVLICPLYFPTCQGCGPLVRENVATGEIVELSKRCATIQIRCFVDECVPAGTYRYGLSKDDRCNRGVPACMSTRAVVGETLLSCERLAHTSDPQPFSGEVVWTDQAVCRRGCECRAVSLGEHAPLPVAMLFCWLLLFLFLRRRIKNNQL